jgi:hypothetical protein
MVQCPRWPGDGGAARPARIYRTDRARPCASPPLAGRAYPTRVTRLFSCAESTTNRVWVHTSSEIWIRIAYYSTIHPFVCFSFNSMSIRRQISCLLVLLVFWSRPPNPPSVICIAHPCCLFPSQSTNPSCCDRFVNSNLGLVRFTFIPPGTIPGDET